MNSTKNVVSDSIMNLNQEELKIIPRRRKTNLNYIRKKEEYQSKFKKPNRKSISLNFISKDKKNSLNKNEL